MEEHRDPKEELHPNEEPQEDSDSSEYSFMQERIKLDRRGIRKGLFKMAGFGLVFGIFACFSFTALKPVMDSIFQDDPQKVTIPQEEPDEEEVEEPVPEPEEPAGQQTLDADSYRQIADYQLIFTKLDETEALGNLLNMRLYTDASIAYVTCGQNVPDDIEVFNPQTTVKKLLGGGKQ